VRFARFKVQGLRDKVARLRRELKVLSYQFAVGSWQPWTSFIGHSRAGGNPGIHFSVLMILMQEPCFGCCGGQNFHIFKIIYATFLCLPERKVAPKKGHPCHFVTCAPRNA
jgi:hypothetical protein